MRIFWFSFRTFWVGFLRVWRPCRRIWLLALAVLSGGVTLGVLTALLVADPTPHSVLGRVLADTYAPFASFGLCFACLSSGVVVTYLSARFPRRILFWGYVAGVGYVLGRLAYFAVLAGVVGVFSLIFCEVAFALLALSFVLGYFCTLRDTLLYTCLPRYNLPHIKAGVRYLVWGTAVLFAYVVVVWGLITALVNIAV